MEQYPKKLPPQVDSRLRHSILEMPVEIRKASDIGQRIASGASILNVAGGANTPAIVRKIRTEYPDFPIIATGGNKPDTIAATVAAGANAITFTPPSAQELFKAMMTRYRDE